jgi:hypothetical protein
MQYFITAQTLNNQNTTYHKKMKCNVELENESNLRVVEVGIFRDEQTVILGM